MLLFQESFTKIDSQWFKELKQHSDPNMFMLLIGNKTDLQHSRYKFKFIISLYNNSHLLWFMSGLWIQNRLPTMLEKLACPSLRQAR